MLQVSFLTLAEELCLLALLSRLWEIPTFKSIQACLLEMLVFSLKQLRLPQMAIPMRPDSSSKGVERFEKGSLEISNAGFSRLENYEKGN